MDERLTNFLLDLLSDKEKLALFEEMEQNEKLRTDFAEAQNLFSVSQMLEEQDDDQYAQSQLDKLKKKTKRIILRSLVIKVSRYAAILLLILGTWLAIERLILTNEGDSLYTEHISPAGKRTKIILSDSSTVYLGPSSIIRIPDSFRKKERIVELNGEALFEVSKDKKRPFIVKTSKYDIRVLGTKFNVRSYSDHPTFETSLLEGSVDIYNSDERIKLKPHDGVVLINNSLVKVDIDISDIDYMTSGIYAFENKPFNEILKKLEIWYNIKFDIKNKRLMKYSLSGKFRENDNVEIILAAIQQIYPFKYKVISENKIEIY